MKKIIFILISLIAIMAFCHGQELIEITTNDISIEQVKELLANGKTLIGSIKGDGIKSWGVKIWIMFVFFCINVLYFILRIIVKITKTKKDDIWLQSKLNPVIAKLTGPVFRILKLFFGKIN